MSSRHMPIASGSFGGKFGNTRPNRAVLLRNTADDIDIDTCELKETGQSPPPLFPPLILPEVPVLDNGDVYRIRKQRRIVYAIQESPFMLHMERETKDVARWQGSAKLDSLSAHKDTLAQCLSSGPEGSMLLPQELLDDTKTGGRRAFKADGKNVGAVMAATYERIDTLTRESLKQLEEKEEDEIGEKADDYMSDTLTEDDDYQHDYFQSDVESDGASAGETTY